MKKIIEFEIQHDDNCSYWKTGICNCKPNVGKQNIETVEQFADLLGRIQYEVHKKKEELEDD